jgi:phosphoribosyl 1,2-cyclic phosphate phosphodiesterase
MMLKFTPRLRLIGWPLPAVGWGACDPRNPKNRRRRTSLLVERQTGGAVTRV